MHNVLHIEWTIISRTPPRPILACSHCGDTRPYRSSGRIRLNANGKRLDAWLIYKCTSCDGTWNRTIFERQSVRSLDPAVIEAMQASTPSFVARLEFDIQALRAAAGRIEDDAHVEVHRRIVSSGVEWQRIEISLRLPAPAGIRLDRLLATELGLSRSRLQYLFETGEIAATPERKDMLRKATRDGTVIYLNLRDETERMNVGQMARGG
ncbi:DUF1062 domain-containing protein [Rhizobium sp. XQZ8]|uniref:DUF1062 domain-containing protein n=1 Tax=Rhizobium populisoli TaxID=2859785 RepID=UPI001CA4E636|nr:DUF1062 domain-containing protein [Rhizobium populisoli]MBW6421200.1 DUF1062 domain-containing protein [Rhizobium populisoli]